MTTTARIAAVAPPDDDVVEAALQDVARFVRRNAQMLVELFEELRDDDGADSVINLIGYCNNLAPPHAAVARELGQVLRALQGVSMLRLDDMVACGEVRLDVYSAVRWSGAAITDLHRRIALD